MANTLSDLVRRALLERLLGGSESLPAAPSAPPLPRPTPYTPHSEPDFQRWYAQKAQQYDMNPNPDDASQFYDYRAAFTAGATPTWYPGHQEQGIEAGYRWPSDFKQRGHDREVVGGFNTITGERDPRFPRADEQELVRLGWDPETARRLAATSEPGR